MIDDTAKENSPKHICERGDTDDQWGDKYRPCFKKYQKSRREPHEVFGGVSNEIIYQKMAEDNSRWVSRHVGTYMVRLIKLI